jgi:hypothetical protein
MTAMTIAHPLDYTGDATTIGLRFVDQLFIGALVTWWHVPRGGYGYETPVPAEVRAVHRETCRATIAAKLAKGGTKHVVVKLASLWWPKVPRPAQVSR